MLEVPWYRCADQLNESAGKACLYEIGSVALRVAGLSPGRRSSAAEQEQKERFGGQRAHRNAYYY